MGDSSTYLNPNSLLQRISSLPQLETLVIIIAFPNPDVETRLLHVPTITHATHPNLRLSSFQGASAYLEVLIRQIATPRLERFHIMFFEQVAFSIPCLVRFINTIESKRLSFDSAKLESFYEQVRVKTYPHDENRRCSFSISVDCLSFNVRISPMAQIVDALGQVLSTKNTSFSITKKTVGRMKKASTSDL